MHYLQHIGQAHRYPFRHAFWPSYMCACTYVRTHVLTVSWPATDPGHLLQGEDGNYAVATLGQYAHRLW